MGKIVEQSATAPSSLSRLRERAGVRAAALRSVQSQAEVMKAAGFQTLRFWNHEVLNETEAVMEKIRLLAETLTPALSRKPERE